MLFAEQEEVDVATVIQETGGVKEDAVIQGLDFIAAIDAHRQWKKRLTDVIEGKSTEILDQSVICQDDKCVLGKWIYCTGKIHCSHMLSFHELKAEHAKFHLQAANVLQLARAGKLEEAMLNVLEGDFAKASRKVQTLLSKVYLEIKA